MQGWREIRSCTAVRLLSLFAALSGLSCIEGEIVHLKVIDNLTQVCKVRMS